MATLSAFCAGTAVYESTEVSGIWRHWTSSGTSATNSSITVSTLSNNVWLSWTSSGTANMSVATLGNYVPTAEDDARWAAERADVAARAAFAEAGRKEAVTKARALLMAMLSAEQQDQLVRGHYFEVVARQSKRRYRIREGSHGNVKLLDAQGREVVSYCGQPNGIPVEDVMLAQKLQIEHDEEAFVRAANAMHLRV